MSWASAFIARLQAGETVKFRPRGNSMAGRIESGQLVTVEPIGSKPVRQDEIVLCKVNGYQYLHIVRATTPDRVQIQNNHGHINGWTMRRHVYGRLTNIEP